MAQEKRIGVVIVLGAAAVALALHVFGSKPLDAACGLAVQSAQAHESSCHQSVPANR